MEANQPRVRVVRRQCAPKFWPCPSCGKRGRRKQIHTRRVRDIAYGEIVFLQVRVGEYRTTCSCCKTFRAAIEGVEPRAQYTNRVRNAVIDRLLDDNMNMERLGQALQRDFYLALSDGFLYDCLDWKIRQINLASYRQWTLANFSGILCIDEIYLGRRILLLATDPLGDFLVGFALVDANDQDHMHRFLINLKNWGFIPQIVVTDGSPLYPTLLPEIWPRTRHQLCIFHVLKDINRLVLDALRRLRRQLAQSQRKRKRGRPTKEQKRARARLGRTKKEQAHFIWKRRYLIVTRPQNLSDYDQKQLHLMFQYLPALRTLRQFVLKVYDLFDPKQSPHQARYRLAVLAKTPEFLADPDLAQALTMVKPEKFDKMIAFLHSPANQRVRTNNHVERTNRRLRCIEKVRYKWRRRRTIVRFVVLTIDRSHQQRLIVAAEPAARPKTKPMSTTIKKAA
jgi:transposase